ncbi:MAG: VCBS repeat-containing protein [Acidobacteriota bacterium]
MPFDLLRRLLRTIAMLYRSPRSVAGAWSFAGWLLIAAATVEAQLPLEPPATVALRDGPASVVLADLDRDGDLDAVFASGPDGTGGDIAWSPSDGVGGWGAVQTIDAAFAFAKDVVAADLDRDGDLDVAAVSFQNNRIAWWENLLGDGSSWSAARIISSSLDGAVALTAADIDRDGDLDLAACARLDNAILWFANDGSPGNGGWVSRQVNHAALPEATDLAIADLDRDGDLDIVAAARGEGQVVWYESDGTPEDGVGGDGTSWSRRTVALGLDAPRAVAVADLDRDGDVDVAVGTADAVTWVARDGGTWAAPVDLGTVAAPRHLEAVDLDRDGDRDLLTADLDEDRVVWWENALDVPAQTFIEHTIDATLDGARGVAAADVENDGDVDIVAGGFFADAVRWFEHDPIHRSASFEPIEVSTGAAFSAAAADLDHDGDLDVVAGTVWHERQGDTFVPRIFDVFGALDALAVGDLDHDGDLDVAGSTGGDLYWWQSDGTPADGVGGRLGTSWTRFTVSTGHARLEELSVVDLDGDGDLDLLASDLNGDEVLWWQSDGSPADEMGGDGNSWTERIVDATTESPRSALARDVDRDGDLDVVVVAQLETPAFWRNDGGAILWTRQEIGGFLTLDAAVVDADADGDLDLLTGLGGSGDGRVQLHEQLSPADGTTWASPTTIGILEMGDVFTDDIAAADFDLDGDSDIAALSGMGRIVWWSNPSLPGGWPRADVAPGIFIAFDVVAAEASSAAIDLLLPGSTGMTLWRNLAAQAELLASDLGVTRLEEGTKTPVLRLNARTLGRSGDNQAEIALLDLLFEEAPGLPADATELSSVVDAVSLYEDIDSSGTFDDSIDFLIGRLSTPTAIAGVVGFELPDFTATIGSSGFRNYFLVIETSADAEAQSLDLLRLTLRIDRSRMEDAVYGAPLILRAPENVSTLSLAIQDVLFADGFESGNLDGWAASSP